MPKLRTKSKASLFILPDELIAHVKFFLPVYAHRAFACTATRLARCDDTAPALKLSEMFGSIDHILTESLQYQTWALKSVSYNTLLCTTLMQGLDLSPTKEETLEQIAAHTSLDSSSLAMLEDEAMRDKLYAMRTDWDKGTYVTCTACDLGDTKILEWLSERGFKFGFDTLMAAAAAGWFNGFVWILQNVKIMHSFLSTEYKVPIPLFNVLREAQRTSGICNRCTYVLGAVLSGCQAIVLEMVPEEQNCAAQYDLTRIAYEKQDVTMLDTLFYKCNCNICVTMLCRAIFITMNKGMFTWAVKYLSWHYLVQYGVRYGTEDVWGWFAEYNLALDEEAWAAAFARDDLDVLDRLRGLKIPMISHPYHICTAIKAHASILWLAAQGIDVPFTSVKFAVERDDLETLISLSHVTDFLSDPHYRSELLILARVMKSHATLAWLCRSRELA